MKQIVSLSGGKDSTAMLLMMMERKEQIDDIVFFDWGMEFPQMYEHLDKLEQYIKHKIVRLHPEHTWDYYMYDIMKVRGPRKGEKGYGWPAFRRRWCTRIKTNTLHAFMKGTIQCIGFAIDESSRANWKANFKYPLLEWGVTGTDALEYCRRQGFTWGGLYEHFHRVSCWHCPLQRLASLRSLRDNYPQLWKKLLEMKRKSLYPYPDYRLDKVIRESLETV